MNHVQAGEKKRVTKVSTTEDDVGLRERVGHMRDIVENVRDQAEVAFRDKPYLVPVTAGALGLGVGLLLGSKLTRFILFTAVGTLVSDALGGELKRMAATFVGELQNRLAEGESEAGATAQPGSSSSTINGR